MPSNERDNERAARALVDAYFTTDAQAAAKHGISTRSIERYRSRLDKDTVLSGLYDDLLDEIKRRPWADQLSETLTAALRRIGAELGTVEIKSLDDVSHFMGLTKELVELEMSRMYAEADTRGSADTDERPGQETGATLARPSAQTLSN